jgi:hypothetical protein
LRIVTLPANGALIVNTAIEWHLYAQCRVRPSDTFTYTVSDNFNVVSNIATVTVNVSASAERIVVLRAAFRFGTGWNISGTTNVPGSLMTIHLGPTLGGRIKPPPLMEWGLA